jgi:hypothetical protein
MRDESIENSIIQLCINFDNEIICDGLDILFVVLCRGLAKNRYRSRFRSDCRLRQARLSNSK